MMNTANVTATTINAAGTTATIMKTNSQQAALSLTSGIIPAAIITTNDRLPTTNNVTHNNSMNALQNHESTNSTSTQPVTAFTIHAPAQSLQALPNNLTISAATSASSVPQTAQIQTMPANTSIIHPVSIGLSSSTAAAATPTSVVCTGTILPVTNQQVTAIPVGVTGPTVLKAQTSATAIPIAQRFQATNVMTSSGSSAALNALYIQHDPHTAKNQSVTLSAPNAHHQTLIQTNSVINATVAGPTVTVHQQIPSAHSGNQPLFIQTSNSAATNAILHTNAAPSGATNSVQMSTMNLSTSAAHHQQQQQQQPQQQTQSQQPPPQPQQPQQQSQQALIQQASTAQQLNNPQFQRLKVEDALSYLDQVKYKFNDQPQVYNDFLDIMKEFKSQSIDTPGVIQRVSNLFRGHPELIVGFNTFLPPGYKIEIHANDQVNVSMPNQQNVVLMSSGPMPTGVATSTIVSGPGVPQNQQTQPSNSGNLSRNSAAPAVSSATSGVNLLQSMNQTFSNSIQSRDATNSPHVNNVVLSQSRVADSHLNRPSNQLLEGSNNSRATLISSSNSASTPSIHGTTPPVEFNHAINYVNKIKNRFATQPEVYKQFLDILQSYQKEQRVKEGPNGQKAILSETEVYAKVAKLFQKQEDLLKEFSQFLPDASGSSSVGGAHSQLNSNLLLATPSHGNSAHNSVSNSTSSNYLNMQPGGQSTAAASAFSHPNVPLGMDTLGSPYINSNNALSNTDHSTLIKKPISLSNSNPPHANRTPNSSNSPNSFPNNMHRNSKRPPANMSSNSFIDQGSEKIQIPNKRSKLLHTRDSGLSETSKYIGELSEYALFDKLRKHLNPYQYENFLKCLVVYNGGVISRTELIQLVTKPIFENYPDLLKRFKDLWNMKDAGAGSQMNSINNAYSFSSAFSNNSYYGSPYSNNYQLEGLSHRVAMMKERGNFDNDSYVELDFNACKRYGISYRSLPKNPNGEKCSGRKNDKICNEVLNDTYVSFPSWSEDSSFVSSRKTQYEEYIYRCEDERYELDHVIETNSATIQLFDTLMKKINNMTEEEKNSYKLDDTLGGRSEVIYKKAIKRVYGEHADYIIDTLKNHPVRTIPLVTSRLVAKEEEWRDAQKHFNKIWREQLEKYYLKSLDHQGINFKQNDIKNLRTKALLNEIETIREMRQKEEQEKEAVNSESTSVTPYQPHMFHVYPDKSMIDVACNLIIHHVKRQTSIHKEDKQKIKQLMRHFIPDLFATQRGELSDDECEDEEEQMEVQEEEPKSVFNLKKTEEVSKPELKEDEVKEEISEPTQPATMLNSDPDDVYALFFVNDYWYYFFRLHYTLCERLSKMHKHALDIAAEEAALQINKDDSPSNKLRLKNTVDIEVDEYFSTLIDMVKQVLDGNLDSNMYEDTLREMFGIHAYISFTLDKLVQYCVRQLQHIVTDEVAWQCNEMFIGAAKTGQAGGSCLTAHKRAEEEATYQKNAETLMTEEPCFKLFIYKGEGKITIELIGSNDDDDDSNNDGDEEPNSQSSRTLRSTAKNPDKFDKWNDMEAYNAMIEERLKDNPRFLERIVRNSKKSKPTLVQDSKDSDKDSSDKDNDIKTNEKPADDEQMSSEENNSPSAQNSEDKDKSQPEIKHLALEKYKSVILANNQHIYRRNALIKARMKHKKVTLKKFDKFNKLHMSWQKDIVTDELRQTCDSWFLSSDVQARISPDESVSTSQNEADQAIRDTTSALLTLTESPVVSANSTTDKSSSSGVEEKANASTSSTNVLTSSNKKMHRVTIDDDSLTPYRSYCKYVFQ